jgi:dihydroorotate dehydrogenase electron transfer subunit
VVLIGGGVGIPPLHFAAKKLREVYQGKIIIEAMLGFREEPWYLTEFESVCDTVHVISEKEGATQQTGNVIDLMDSVDGIASCCDRAAACNDKEETCNDEAGVRKGGGVLALSCGPRIMLEAVSVWCADRDLPLRVSLEERMGCGYGACAGCTVNIREDEMKVVRKKVCVDGPVFWADEVVW